MLRDLRDNYVPWVGMQVGDKTFISSWNVLTGVFRKQWLVCCKAGGRQEADP